MSPLFGWYAQTFSPRIASIRLRCLVPMRELRRDGLEVEPYAASRQRRYRAVVFSKIYDERALATAAALNGDGVRVILDLCDNHFFGEETDGVTRERAGRLERMIAIADLVVSSTDALMAQLRARFPAAADRLTIIPDYLEDAIVSHPSIVDRIALRRLDGFLRRHPDHLRLIWFGNHGASPAPAGMADLLKVRSVIEANSATRPVLLTVMSSSFRKYRRLIAGWSIPTTYVTWTPGRAGEVLRRHQVAVLPIDRNPFTMAKTINRPATAILAGLGVIADSIPSYEELRPFIHLDDWAEGLRSYARTDPSEDVKREEGRQHLLDAYRAETITRMWRAVLG